MKNLTLASRLSTLLRVIGTDTDQLAACDFLLTFHTFMGLSRTVSHYKRRFQSKIPNFPQPRVFNAPAEWVLLGIE